MKHHPPLIIGRFVLLASCLASGVQAYDLPPLNLGFTSFLDGGPPAGPGFYFTEYLQYYHADRFNDAQGSEIPFPDPKVDVFVSLSQFIYQSDQKLLLGGKWGADVIIPVAVLDADYAAAGPFPQDNGGGLGDILIGPFIQWDPIMGQKGPIFMQRVEFQCLVPTGKYDSNRELNPGSGFFSFNPYWAGTFFATPQWTTTMRVHYLWNAENDDPNRGFGGASTSQAGQAVHLNFASAYEVIAKRLRVGINGYYLKQFTNTEADGANVSGRKEQVLGIGPGAVYHFSPDNHLFFNVYFETATENRTQGMRFNLRYVHHF